MEIGVSSNDTPGLLESSRGRVSLLSLAAWSVYSKKNKEIYIYIGVTIVIRRVVVPAGVHSSQE